MGMIEPFGLGESDCFFNYPGLNFQTTQRQSYSTGGVAENKPDALPVIPAFAAGLRVHEHAIKSVHGIPFGLGESDCFFNYPGLNFQTIRPPRHSIRIVRGPVG
jgi:hypothetical protein